jgi:cytochrome c oxidase subunit 2
MTRLHLRLAGLVAALFLSACATEYSRSSLNPTTDFAQTIHGLYTSVFWWTVFILSVVWIILGYVLVRFRERPGAPLPKQTHGHLGIEVAWTLGPTLIVIAIAVPTIQALFATQRGDPESAYVIDVIGHQFWWEFRYPEGVVTANELHLPVGRPISLRLHSADVIHSFWVPQLGGKRDLNPRVQKPEGESVRYNWLHFTVQEPGVYSGQCAEFCGTSHALMGTRVVVGSEAEFQEWLSAWARGDTTALVPQAAPAPPAGADSVAPPTSAPGGASDPADTAAATGVQTPAAAATEPAAVQDPVSQGRQLFQTGICIGCHAIQGTPAQGIVGPNLTLFGRRTTLAAGWLQSNEDNLVRWILSPSSVKSGVLMPGAQGMLTEEQVRSIAAYLLSLR